MMEDHRNNLIVIVAGYDCLMKEFIESNPGLKSRFTRVLHLMIIMKGSFMKYLQGYVINIIYSWMMKQLNVLQNTLNSLLRVKQKILVMQEK